MAERRIRFSARLARAAALLLRVYFRLVWATARIEVLNAPSRSKELSERPGGILCCWHGRLLFCMYDCTTGIRPALLGSRSADAQLVLDAMRPWTAEPIRGSSNTRGKDKGGRAAMEAAISYLRQDKGRYICMTPDGPRGPRGYCKPGVSMIAIRSGRHVIPAGYSCSFGIDFLSAWDTTLLPLPFCKFVIAWGEPLVPPLEGSRDENNAFLMQIEAGITAAQAAADAHIGRKKPFEAMPPSAETAE